jgi:hypothetical protein
MLTLTLQFRGTEPQEQDGHGEAGGHARLPGRRHGAHPLQGLLVLNAVDVVGAHILLQSSLLVLNVVDDLT